jgi:hypothetical protein
LGGVRWQLSGQRLRQVDIGRSSLAASRPLLEGQVRRRVKALPSVVSSRAASRGRHVLPANRQDDRYPLGDRGQRRSGLPRAWLATAAPRCGWSIPTCPAARRGNYRQLTRRRLHSSNGNGRPAREPAAPGPSTAGACGHTCAAHPRRRPGQPRPAAPVSLPSGPRSTRLASRARITCRKGASSSALEPRRRSAILTR